MNCSVDEEVLSATMTTSLLGQTPAFAPCYDDLNYAGDSLWLYSQTHLNTHQSFPNSNLEPWSAQQSPDNALPFSPFETVPLFPTHERDAPNMNSSSSSVMEHSTGRTNASETWSPTENNTVDKGTTRKRKRQAKSKDKQISAAERIRQTHLERNRRAAERCRDRRRREEDELETRSAVLESVNNELKECVLGLQQELINLKTQCLKHVGCNCMPIRRYLIERA